MLIPLSRITALEVVHKHLGKPTTSQLLRVTFTKHGDVDRVAYWLPKPAELKKQIEARAAYTAGAAS